MKPDNPDFYKGKYRSNFQIVDKVKVNTLPTLTTVKDFYEVHMFEDGYIGVYNTDRKKYVKPHIGDKSSYYFRYGLRTTKNKSKTVYMHRLVGLAWVSGWAVGKVIDHKDNNQLNNLKENLEWVLPEINTKRAVVNGCGIGRPRVVKYKLTQLQKSELSSKRLSTKEIEMIFELFEAGQSVSEIAKELNVTQACISQILNGKRWKTHPASKYYFSRRNIG